MAENDSKILPKPIGRSEKYFAAWAGEDIKLPKPVTREEQYLAAIVEKWRFQRRQLH